MMPRLMIGIEGLDEDDGDVFGGNPVVAFLFDRQGELLGGEVVHWPTHPEAIKRTHASLRLPHLPPGCEQLAAACSFPFEAFASDALLLEAACYDVAAHRLIPLCRAVTTTTILARERGDITLQPQGASELPASADPLAGGGAGGGGGGTSASAGPSGTDLSLLFLGQVARHHALSPTLGRLRRVAGAGAGAGADGFADVPPSVGRPDAATKETARRVRLRLRAVFSEDVSDALKAKAAGLTPLQVSLLGEVPSAEAYIGGLTDSERKEREPELAQVLCLTVRGSGLPAVSQGFMRGTGPPVTRLRVFRVSDGDLLRAVDAEAKGHAGGVSSRFLSAAARRARVAEVLPEGRAAGWAEVGYLQPGAGASGGYDPPLGALEIPLSRLGADDAAMRIDAQQAVQQALSCHLALELWHCDGGVGPDSADMALLGRTALPAVELLRLTGRHVRRELPGNKRGDPASEASGSPLREAVPGAAAAGGGGGASDLDAMALDPVSQLAGGAVELQLVGRAGEEARGCSLLLTGVRLAQRITGALVPKSQRTLVNQHAIYAERREHAARALLETALPPPLRVLRHQLFNGMQLLPILAFDLSAPGGGSSGAARGGDARREDREKARLAAETRRHTWLAMVDRKCGERPSAASALCRACPADYLPRGEIVESTRRARAGSAAAGEGAAVGGGAADWEVVEPEDGGRAYYWNRRTNETQWKKPLVLRSKKSRAKIERARIEAEEAAARRHHAGRARSFELAAERVAEEALRILGAFAPRSRRGAAAFCFGFGARLEGLPYTAGEAFPLGATLLLEGAAAEAAGLGLDGGAGAGARAEGAVAGGGRRGTVTRSDASGLAWAGEGPPAPVSAALAAPHHTYELDRPAGALTDATPREEDEGSRFMQASRLRGPLAVRRALRTAMLSASGSYGGPAGAKEEAGGPGPIARAIDSAVALVQIDAPSPGRQRYGVCVVCLHRPPSMEEVEQVISRLVRCTVLPLSFVFVGAGGGEFGALERAVGGGVKPCRSVGAGVAPRANAAFVNFRELQEAAAAAVEEWEEEAEERETGAEEALPGLASPADEVRRAIHQRMFGCIPFQFMQFCNTESWCPLPSHPTSAAALREERAADRNRREAIDGVAVATEQAVEELCDTEDWGGSDGGGAGAAASAVDVKAALGALGRSMLGRV